MNHRNEQQHNANKMIEKCQLYDVNLSINFSGWKEQGQQEQRRKCFLMLRPAVIFGPKTNACADLSKLSYLWIWYLPHFFVFCNPLNVYLFFLISIPGGLSHPVSKFSDIVWSRNLNKKNLIKEITMIYITVQSWDWSVFSKYKIYFWQCQQKLNMATPLLVSFQITA